MTFSTKTSRLLNFSRNLPLSYFPNKSINELARAFKFKNSNSKLFPFYGEKNEWENLVGAIWKEIKALDCCQGGAGKRGGK